MRRILTAVSCGTLLVAGGLSFVTRFSGGAPGGPRAEAAPADSLGEATTRLEKQLEAELRARSRGLASDEDVDRARVDLAKARHDEALANSDRAGMVEQCRVILAVRQREWQRLAPAIQRGALDAAEVDVARRRPAVARYFLAVDEQRTGDARDELKFIAEVCDREAQRLARGYAGRVVSLRDLNAARNRAASARYLLARAGEQPDGAIRECDRTVALWEGEAARVSRLYQAGSAHYLEDLDARTFLIDARIRRAACDGDREAIAALLKERIALREDAVPRLAVSDPVMRRIRPRVEWQLAADRHFLERLRQGGEMPPDTAATYLDG
jgi:hypothetical protein